MTLPIVRIWIDPTCPWAWQTAKWARALRDDGVIDLEWSLFSLELQAMPDAPFDEATTRGGDALRGLALARSTGGAPAFERLYVAIGSLVHDRREPISPDIVRAAAVDAGMDGVVQGALADGRCADEVAAEFAGAHREGVFGVPTISIDGTKPLFGPVFAAAPPDPAERAAMFEHVRWLAQRGDFFELKRLRDRRPGAA